MKKLVTPIKGFPEYGTDMIRLFDWAKNIIEKEYKNSGFAHLETPVVERVETLISKGGVEKEIYAVKRLEDVDEANVDTKLALRFDLTVPLARYVSQHKSDIKFPFRRYQIGKVWRGEKPQKGRYREFYQCDIDIIGMNRLSILNDAEIPFIIYGIFKKMNIGNFIIKISNRKILTSTLLLLGLGKKEIPNALRSIDKIEKIGERRVAEELEQLGLTQKGITELRKLFKSDSNQNLLEILMTSQYMDDSTFAEGCEELRTVYEGVIALGVPEEYVTLDISLARGLGYYTGTIYETVLVDFPKIGSICSGGRYDNLTNYFDNASMPGVGISIGLSRLIPTLVNAGILSKPARTPTLVYIAVLEVNRIFDYLTIAKNLRKAGISTEVHLEGQTLGKQLKIASHKGIPFVLLIGEEEWKKDQVLLKNMETGTQVQVLLNNLESEITKLINT